MSGQLTRERLDGPIVVGPLYDQYQRPLLTLTPPSAGDAANTPKLQSAAAAGVVVYGVDGPNANIALWVQPKPAATGSIVLDGVVTISGGLTVGGNLTVTGTSALNGKVTVNVVGDATTGVEIAADAGQKALHVTAGTVDFDTATNIDGAATLGSTLVVAAGVTLNNTSGTTLIKGNTTINPGTLTVQGATQLNAGLTQAGGNATFDGTTLVVDALQDRVGIGVSSLAHKLHVQDSLNNTVAAYVRNQTSGTLALASFLAENSAGNLAHSGVTSPGYTGFAPINGGAGFWLSNGVKAVYGAQDLRAIEITQNGATVASWNTLGLLTQAAGVTITTGGLLVSAGGFSVSAGGASIVGGLTLTGSGDLTLFNQQIKQGALTYTLPASSQTLVGRTTTDTLTNKTLTTPVIADFTSAAHDHGDADDGGRLVVGATASVPRARAYNSANISINTATLTALTFNSERWDTDTIHDTAVNTGRLTCKTAGLYTLSASIAFASNATGVRFVGIKINGVYVAFHGGAAASGLDTRVTVATQYEMAVNDFAEVDVYQDSGGALNVLAAGNYSPEFLMTWHSPIT
jgi:hypothetical protein